MSDLISRQTAIDAITDERIVANMDSVYDSELHRCKRATQRILASLPPARPEPTLYGYQIEHLEMIARVMAKENCTPEDVVRMLQNAGEIAKMVRDEMMEMLKESIERSCKGVANERTD